MLNHAAAQYEAVDTASAIPLFRKTVEWNGFVGQSRAMPTAIAMHRGINVGSHNRIKMDALKALYTSLKFGNPETYVQSGNVVFEANDRDFEKLANRIETAFELSFGFRSAVVLRSLPEMRDVVAANPFAGRQDVHPGKLLVTFFPKYLDLEGREKVSAMKVHLEEMHVHDRELYVYYPLGAGQSKLQLKGIEKALDASGTARNWNSVLAVISMAERR